MITMKGFTIIELMLALLFSSLLMLSLVTVYASFMRRYRLFSSVVTLQEDGTYLVTLLRRKIHSANAGFELYTASTIPPVLKSQLRNVGDVLITIHKARNHFIRSAYYVSAASWRYRHKRVLSFFEKTLPGRRRELVSHVSHFRLVSFSGSSGIRYQFNLLSTGLPLRFSQTWFGFGCLPHGG